MVQKKFFLIFFLKIVVMELIALALDATSIIQRLGRAVLGKAAFGLNVFALFLLKDVRHLMKGRHVATV